MENSLQDAIQKMGSNFLVAAFIPAMGFILAVYFFFSPIFSFHYPDSLIFLIEKGVILLLLTAILGFSLYTISTYIYKAFEGYTFILGRKTGLRRSLLERQAKRFNKFTFEKKIVELQLEKTNRKIEGVLADPKTGKWRNKRLNRLLYKKNDLEKVKYELTSILDHDFPPSKNLIMPTRFGNLLRAAEMYPKRYGIDAVPLWGRLVCAMPSQEGMMEKINESNIQCQFLLNGAVLGIFFAVISLAAAAYETGLWWLKISNDFQGNGQMALAYTGLMVGALIVARFFYEASLFNVSQFGSMIRASYDLYRFHLIEALRLKLPKNLSEEKQIWLKLSNFMTGSLDYKEEKMEIFDETMGFEYVHPLKEAKSSDCQVQ